MFHLVLMATQNGVKQFNCYKIHYDSFPNIQPEIFVLTTLLISTRRLNVPYDFSKIILDFLIFLLR